MMKTSTYFALLAEFGTSEIPLADCCEKYFGLSERTASNKAKVNQLPIPVYRARDSQKSPLLVNAGVLAEHIDRQIELAKQEWDLFNK
jgi:hypothetical protein